MQILFFLLQLGQQDLQKQIQKWSILSTQDEVKLLQEFKSYFKQTITWNKCQFKLAPQTQTQYLDYLIDPRFQG